MSPASINTSAGPAEVTVSGRVTDDLSGFGGAFIQFNDPRGLGHVVWPHFDNPDPSCVGSGSPLDWTFSCTLTVPENSAPGTYVLEAVAAEDNAGNQSNIWEYSELIEAGLYTTFRVIA